MTPPLSRADIEAIAREVHRLGAPAKVVEVRPRQPSSNDLRAEAMRAVSDTKVALEDRSLGFERMMMTAVGRLEEKIDATAKSIPPAATAAKGAENAALRAEGRTEAVQVAANRADTNSLAAKVSAHRAFIVVVLGIVIQVAWQAYQELKPKAAAQADAAGQVKP